jgi:uncharacterized membrane protein
MASDAVYGAIKDYLVANWTSTPISFENENFVQPDPPAPWIAVFLSGVVYGQQTIGTNNQAANRWDEEGILWLFVMVPVGTGSLDARRCAKQLADLFRGVTLLSGSLEFRDAFIGQGELAVEVGNWFKLPVDIEWRRIDA